MNDSSEFIGSMPSTPLIPLPAPVQAAKATNSRSLIGFFLWSVCFLVFPTYAQTDNLGSGIFYGIGSLLLFIVIVGLCQTLTRRTRTNRPAKAPVIRQRSSTSRRLRLINGVLAGIVLFLVGVYLLMSLEIPSVGDVSLLGLLFCTAGLIVSFFAAISYIHKKLAPVQSEATPGTRTQAQRRASTIKGGIYILFIAGSILAFARETSLNAFYRGILYGMGLFLLLTAIISLNSVIAKSTANKAA